MKIADVSGISGPYILEIKEHIKEEGLRKTVHLEPGSLVLSNSATPGIPKILSIDTCIHDGWLYFPQSQFTNEWLYCYFLNVRQELVRMANGSVFQNLKTDIVKNFEVIRPDDETLASFQEMVAPLFNLMESCQKENKQLADLRDTLLPKLMSGEIDVSQVDLTQLNSHLAALWSCGRRSRRLSWVSVVTDANDMSNPGHRVTLTADQFAGVNPMAGDGTTAALRLGRRHRRGLLGLAYIQLLWARGLILLHDALSRPLNRHPVCTPDGPT